MTLTDLDSFIKNAIQSSVLSCIIPSFWVKKTVRELKESKTQVSAYVGYPFGFQDTASKVFEVKEAIRQGTNEIDLVWSQTAYHSGMNWPKIEIAQISKICHDEGKFLKVTIEEEFLSEEQLLEACLICQDAGADYIKTGTGVSNTKISSDRLMLMRGTLSSNVGLIVVGSTSYQESLLLIEAGADRICSPNAFFQLKDWKSKN